MMKIALVGYGYWGPNVARNLYNNKQWDFTVICDKKIDRLKKAEGLYANALSYTQSFQDIIDDDTLDAVAVAVETSAHYELAKAVLNANKHLYIEKPFTDNTDQADLHGFFTM